jgi:hypothetical protein
MCSMSRECADPGVRFELNSGITQTVRQNLHLSECLRGSLHCPPGHHMRDLT